MSSLVTARSLSHSGLGAPGVGAESYQMLLERIKPWLDALDRQTVCVTHGGIFRVLFRMAGRKPKKEAAALDVAQDRVLRFEDGKLEWL